MPTPRHLFVPLVLVASLTGCGEGPTLAVGPPAQVSVHRADPIQPTSELMRADGEIGPIGFAFEGARGYVRVTMEIEGTADVPEPFVHDALFLVNGDGRLSIAVRKPWPDHERGRVSIRCEASTETSTIDYEPELWFGKPTIQGTVEIPMGDQRVSLQEGTELVLTRVVVPTGESSEPISVTFKIDFAAEPIKPRVRAGMRKDQPKE